MKFFRKQPPRKYRDYHKYRQYTREDFRRVCAYCFRHEDEAGGEDQFVQDHFEPKHRQNVDPADYFNLYWACGACNAPQNKGRTWPSPAEALRGETFCDPCDHDPVGTDYVDRDSGELKAITPAGKYTIRHIRLNTRQALVDQRLTRRRIRRSYELCLRTLRAALAKWQEQPGFEAAEKCRKLSDFVEEYESFVAREPFMLYGPFPAVPPLDLIENI